MVQLPHTVHLALGALLISCTVCGTGATSSTPSTRSYERTTSCTSSQRTPSCLAAAHSALPTPCTFARCTAADSMHRVCGTGHCSRPRTRGTLGQEHRVPTRHRGSDRGQCADTYLYADWVARGARHRRGASPPAPSGGAAAAPSAATARDGSAARAAGHAAGAAGPLRAAAAPEAGSRGAAARHAVEQAALIGMMAPKVPPRSACLSACCWS